MLCSWSAGRPTHGGAGRYPSDPPSQVTPLVKVPRHGAELINPEHDMKGTVGLDSNGPHPKVVTARPDLTAESN